MRIRVLSVLLLTLAGGMTFSLIRGQERLSGPAPKPLAARETTPPANLALPIPSLSSAPPSTLTRGPAHDFSKLGELQKEMLVSCQRGADWLSRVNGVKGRFLSGYLPALGVPMEGDHYLRQVGASFALARAARFLSDDRYAARATQAILTLLDDTVETDDKACRHTSLPSPLLNRLGTAGLLVLAINELPSPQADLLDKSEQMCNWIRRQARADGSLRCNDSDDTEGKPAADDADSVKEYPGLALYAVLRSQRHRPAAWKTELARKAVVYYRGWWNEHRGMAFIPWQTAANAEAFVQTKEASFAQFVYQMNDWLCGLQYDHIEPRRVMWYGGFMPWVDGKVLDTPPSIDSAVYAESIAEARRVARAGSDVARYQRYTEVMHRVLQFLVRLQYTDAKTGHFEEWYRPRLVGGFHASAQDGNLRIDYAQHALSALVTYLEEACQ
jgi:hypothetical protein